MRIFFKKVVILYFRSWWLSSAVALFLLLAFMVNDLISLTHPYSRPFWSLGKGLFSLLAVALLGIVIVGIWHCTRKRWARGLVSLFVMFPLLVGVSLLGGSFLAVACIFGPSEDGYGKDIVIPPDMKMEEPDQLQDNGRGAPTEDPEGKELIDIFSNSSLWPDEPVIDTNIPVLDEFIGEKQTLLMRHLATSAKWGLRRDRGKVYAFRRFITDEGRWETTLNGNYTDHDWRGVNRNPARFQVKIVIGLNGQVTPKTPIINPIVMKTGSGKIALEAKDAPAWPGNETHLVLCSIGPTIEILEIAETMMRPFSMLALEQIQSEFKALLNSETARDKGYDPSLVPPASISRGKPDIRLSDGMQGGIYLVNAYINPGEPGYTYLKVFEATWNSRLSENRITQYSSEYVGWSGDQEELFFYQTHITVYEGDWGVYYPARFELWLVPDSGQPERKLVEKTFKIEGWQR